jgi:quercetin dioxygenase-like cupin family protein
MKTTRMMTLALVLIGSTMTLAPAQAQQPALQRTDLLQDDIDVPGHEVVQVRVDFERGATSIKHSHPGEEVAYVLEGSLEYQLEGRQAILLNAGESLFIPAEVAHIAKNVGSGKASELATYIVQKGAPLVVPVK